MRFLIPVHDVPCCEPAGKTLTGCCHCSYFIYSTVEGVSFQPRDVPIGPVDLRLARLRPLHARLLCEQVFCQLESGLSNQ